MPSRKLKSLLNHVDGWFKDLTLDAPIEQFQLEVDRKDRAKLAIINRTTNNWFQAFNSIDLLTNEGVTREDLGIEEEVEDNDKELDLVETTRPKRQCRRKAENVKQHKVATKVIRAPSSRVKKKIEEAEESRLNLLVQDLEQLLEKKVEDELVCDFYQIYPSDDIALHCDSSIGHCLTIDMHPPTIDTQKSQSKKRTTKTGSQPSYTTVIMATRSATLSSQLNVSPATATPAPSKDHDYIIAPQVMMPVCTNKCKMEHLILNRAERRAARVKRDTLAVLNTGAIKRFARFSDRFRVLSEKQESVKLEA